MPLDGLKGGIQRKRTHSSPGVSCLLGLYIHFGVSEATYKEQVILQKGPLCIPRLACPANFRQERFVKNLEHTSPQVSNADYLPRIWRNWSQSRAWFPSAYNLGCRNLSSQPSRP